MLIINEPVPVPLEALVLSVVGLFGLLHQHIPRSVTLAPPSEVIVPPLMAVIIVIEVASVVVNVARTGVENEISCPYAVPTELVAKALTW
jgi:hypothetical protein